MKIIWIFLCIIYDISLFSVFAAAEIESEIPDEKKCSSNLSPYHITTSFGPKIICAYISSERLNWDDAKFRCNLLFAQLTQQIHFKSSLRTDLLNKGIDVLWMGIRRRNNFFVTEYPSKLFREADSFSPDYWGYHWSSDEPGLNDCVALNISDGSLQTRSCGDILPFVCDDDGKDISTIYKNLECPEGWNLSFALSSSGRTCISVHKARLYVNAEEICAKNGGRLATFKEHSILSTKNFLNAEEFWIKKKKSKLCSETNRDIKGFLSKTSSKSCILKYPFVCVKHYKIPSISVRLSPKSIQSMKSDSKDAVDLLTCDLESEVSELNIESGLWLQWYKNDLPISANSHVIRLSFTGDALKRDPYIYDIASTQGYYHCEVQIPGSNVTHFSPKMKFFYSDIATYVVEIRGIKPANDFDYSHQNFFSYMDYFDEASMSNILKKVKIRYPEVEWDFMSKSTLNGETTLKIVVYIYKTGIEDFDERMACEEVKDAFEEVHSVPVYMEKMSVYINCEEFPIRNGYVQVIKTLQNIEDKLNHMEETQEYILQKLQDCEKSKNIELEKNNYDDEIELLLKIVDDLGRLKKNTVHKTPEHENSENEHDEREINELEDIVLSLAREKFFDKSNNLKRRKSTIIPFKSHDFGEEVDDYYIHHPEEDWP